jgi:hypothetical protein
MLYLGATYALYCDSLGKTTTVLSLLPCLGINNLRRTLHPLIFYDRNELASMGIKS